MNEVEALAAELSAAPRIGVAAISLDASAVRADVVGWAFAAAPERAAYIPMGHTGLADTPNLRAADVFARIGPVLASPAVIKVGHDMKFLEIAASREGVTLAGPMKDTLVESYLLDATRSSHAIEAMALERLGYRGAAPEEVTGKGAKALSLGEVPAGTLAAFAGERAELPLAMVEGLEADMAKDGLDAVYRDLEEPLIPVLAGLERAGIKVDTAVLAGLGASMQKDLDDLAAEVVRQAGLEFNINSPKQLGEVLFTKLNLQSTKKTGKTRAVSTAQDVQEVLARVHEIPGLLL
jgi:DNA polymerase-1